MTLISFEDVLIKEINEPLVDLDDYDFVLESSYYNQGLSQDKKLYLRKGVVDKLVEIQTKLSDYKFKIWDGCRSRDVQNNIYQKFWTELKMKHPEWDDDRLKHEVGVFVTDPSKSERIPPHATGGAVDLTLVDSQGNELDMGTDFDFFGPEAASLYYESHSDNETVKANRKLLRESMIAAGFRSDTDEWWHFDYGNQIWAAELNKPCAIYGEASLGM